MLPGGKPGRAPSDHRRSENPYSLCFLGIPAFLPGEDPLCVLVAPHIGSSLSRKTPNPLHVLPGLWIAFPALWRLTCLCDLTSVSAAMMSSSVPYPDSSALLLALGSLFLPRVSLLWPRPALAHQLQRWLAWGASAQLLGLTRLWGTTCFLNPRQNFSRLYLYVSANLAKS